MAEQRVRRAIFKPALDEAKTPDRVFMHDLVLDVEIGVVRHLDGVTAPGQPLSQPRQPHPVGMCARAMEDDRSASVHGTVLPQCQRRLRLRLIDRPAPWWMPPVMYAFGAVTVALPVALLALAWA